MDNLNRSHLLMESVLRKEEHM